MRCKSCLIDKVTDAFYVSNKTRCKACVKASVNAYRQENLEKIRAYDKMRASQPHRMVLAKRVSAEWQTRFPERRAANVALGNAVRDGKVLKQPCWVCGLKAVAHHPDYDRPLDVVWLCQPHHKQAHALVEAA